MSILQMSISAGLLVIATVIIRSVALNRLPKTMFLVLWGIALCRLLIPFSIPSQASIYSIIGDIFKRVAPDIPVAPVIDAILSTENLTVGITGQTLKTAQVKVFTMTPMTVIWLVGMLAVFTFLAALYVKNYRELRFALPIRDNEFLNEWLAEYNILRSIIIMQSDRITTPVAARIVKPRIILPKVMDMDDKQLLKYVLMHEYYHIRRFDALWKLLLALAVCVHWFNPLVWVMFILVNRDLEITCDEMVVRHFGTDTKTAYAYSLISMADQRRKFAPLDNGFSKNAAEERITAIMKNKKTSFITICASVVLIVILGTVFTTTTTAMASSNNKTDTAEGLIPMDYSITSTENQNYSEIRTAWEEFGVIYDDETGRVYYKGQIVRFFVDNRSTDPTHHFNGTVYDMGDGSYYLVTRRDETGKLIGIDEVTEEEASQIARQWR